MLTFRHLFCSSPSNRNARKVACEFIISTMLTRRYKCFVRMAWSCWIFRAKILWAAIRSWHLDWCGSSHCALMVRNWWRPRQPVVWRRIFCAGSDNTPTNINSKWGSSQPAGLMAWRFYTFYMDSGLTWIWTGLVNNIPLQGKQSVRLWYGLFSRFYNFSFWFQITISFWFGQTVLTHRTTIGPRRRSHQQTGQKIHPDVRHVLVPCHWHD